MTQITTADRIINALRFSAINPPEGYTVEQLDAAQETLRGLHHHAREWNWGTVTRILDAAYDAIGATNPGTGYQYHCGTHPVQLAEADVQAQIDAEDEAASERTRVCKAACVSGARS